MMEGNIITVPEQLEELYKRYPIPRALDFAEDGMSYTAWSHDGQGNELKITVKAGDSIRYEEKHARPHETRL